MSRPVGMVFSPAELAIAKAALEIAEKVAVIQQRAIATSRIHALAARFAEAARQAQEQTRDDHTANIAAARMLARMSGKHVCHIDGDPTNNDIANLRIVEGEP